MQQKPMDDDDNDDDDGYGVSGSGELRKVGHSLSRAFNFPRFAFAAVFCVNIVASTTTRKSCIVEVCALVWKWIASVDIVRSHFQCIFCVLFCIATCKYVQWEKPHNAALVHVRKWNCRWIICAWCARTHTDDKCMSVERTPICIHGRLQRANWK